MLLLNLPAPSQVPNLTSLFHFALQAYLPPVQLRPFKPGQSGKVSRIIIYLSLLKSLNALVFYFTYFLRALLDDTHLSDELLWKLMTNCSSLCYYSNNKSNLNVAFNASVERNLLSKRKLGLLQRDFFR